MKQSSLTLVSKETEEKAAELELSPPPPTERKPFHFSHSLLSQHRKKLVLAPEFLSRFKTLKKGIIQQQAARYFFNPQQVLLKEQLQALTAMERDLKQNYKAVALYSLIHFPALFARLNLNGCLQQTAFLPWMNAVFHYLLQRVSHQFPSTRRPLSQHWQRQFPSPKQSFEEEVGRQSLQAETMPLPRAEWVHIERLLHQIAILIRFFINRLFCHHDGFNALLRKEAPLSAFSPDMLHWLSQYDPTNDYKAWRKNEHFYLLKLCESACFLEKLLANLEWLVDEKKEVFEAQLSQLQEAFQVLEQARPKSYFSSRFPIRDLALFRQCLKALADARGLYSAFHTLCTQQWQSVGGFLQSIEGSDGFGGHHHRSFWGYNTVVLVKTIAMIIVIALAPVTGGAHIVGIAIGHHAIHTTLEALAGLNGLVEFSHGIEMGAHLARERHEHRHTQKTKSILGKLAPYFAHDRRGERMGCWVAYFTQRYQSVFAVLTLSSQLAFVRGALHLLLSCLAFHSTLSKETPDRELIETLLNLLILYDFSRLPHKSKHSVSMNPMLRTQDGHPFSLLTLLQTPFIRCQDADGRLIQLILRPRRYNGKHWRSPTYSIALPPREACSAEVKFLNEFFKQRSSHDNHLIDSQRSVSSISDKHLENLSFEPQFNQPLSSIKAPLQVIPVEYKSQSETIQDQGKTIQGLKKKVAALEQDASAQPKRGKNKKSSNSPRLFTTSNNESNNSVADNALLKRISDLEEEAVETRERQERK